MPVRRHRRTIELDRNYLNAYLDWCGAVASGNYNAARAWQVFAREPNNANAYELMGAMLMQQGRSKAIAALKVSNAGSKTPVCFCSWDLFG